MLRNLIANSIFNKSSLAFFCFNAILSILLFKYSKNYNDAYMASDLIKFYFTVFFIIPAINFTIFNNKIYNLIFKNPTNTNYIDKPILNNYIFIIFILSLYFSLPFFISDFFSIHRLCLSYLELFATLLIFSVLLLFYIIISIPFKSKLSKLSLNLSLLLVNFIFFINVPCMIDSCISYSLKIDFNFFIRFSPIVPFWVKWCKTWGQKNIANGIAGIPFEPILGISSDFLTALLLLIFSILWYYYLTQNFQKHIEANKDKNNFF